MDIDECSGSHICSEFAQCYNRNGGYDCDCLAGYEGNGYDCQRILSRDYGQTSNRDSGRDATTPSYGTQIEGCGDCSENAYCSEGVCVCNSGFIGNGRDCRMICALNEVFNGATCVKIATAEEGKSHLMGSFISAVKFDSFQTKSSLTALKQAAFVLGDTK